MELCTIFIPPPFLSRSLSPVNTQLSWGRADGWAQLATCRRSQTLRASLSGVGGGGEPQTRRSQLASQQKKKIKKKTNSLPGTSINAINNVKNVPYHQPIPTRYAFPECAKIVSQGHVLILVGRVCLFIFLSSSLHTNDALEKCIMGFYYYSSCSFSCQAGSRRTRFLRTVA